MRTQLHWSGNVSRMEDHHLLKIVLYGELATSCHKREAPKKRYKNSALAILTATNGPLWPPFGIHGDTPFTILLLPLRMHAESVLRRKDNAERTVLANIAKGDVQMCLL
ncbi:hypothetical protein WISP_38498 [Willisornis vidua]|uniref:Uncharacterized protein n=1 Tax=Willisornis vidua TaxID=1566151 RepID=A0ABQ9DNR3_9PASS|nr:hypothetical protein WISP_38498 [Willisornis vidua]